MNLHSVLAFAVALLVQPALAQEREWSFDANEDEAFMIFGVPESDDVGVSFWCSLRSGRIRLFIPEASEKLEADKSAAFDVIVGGKTFKQSGKTMPNEEAGTTSIEGEVAVADPMFSELKSASHFELKVEGEVQAFPLAGAEFDTLLKDCGGT